LCSFQLVDYDFLFAFPAEEMELEKDMEGPDGPIPMPALDVSEFKCEIIVLGLR